MSAFAATAVATLAMATVMPTPTPAAHTDVRAAERASGGDRKTAERVAHVLLAQPLALQLLKVRCERVGVEDFCGLTLSGVKFKRRVDTASFQAEVDGLVRGAFDTDPEIAEVDLWVTVPLGAGKGAVVSGDFAQPTSATVFATTVPRALAAHPSAGDHVFWDATFRKELASGSNG